MAKKVSRGESKLSPRRINAVTKQRQALELRMAGRTWQEIANTLGYANHSGAFHAVKTALQSSLQAPAQHYRDLTLERLTKILQVHWPLMLQADGNSTRLCLQTIKEIRELLGLDSPAKFEHTGADGSPIQHEVITLDIGDITEALTVLQDAGAVRVESNGHSPVALDALHTT
jgi:hypothetical protein